MVAVVVVVDVDGCESNVLKLHHILRSIRHIVNVCACLCTYVMVLIKIYTNLQQLHRLQHLCHFSKIAFHSVDFHFSVDLFFLIFTFDMSSQKYRRRIFHTKLSVCVARPTTRYE